MFLRISRLGAVAISISMADMTGGGEVSFGTSLMIVPWGVLGSERLRRHFFDLDTFVRVRRGVESDGRDIASTGDSWAGEGSSWPRRLNMDMLRRAMLGPAE
jgi:hypothetical protein